MSAATAGDRIQAARLFLAWRDVLVKHLQLDTDRTREAEQRAHDALVDFIEDHDLNDSEFDPRDAR